MKYKVNAENPPPYCPGVQYWERSGDPFNPGLLAAALEAEGIRSPIKDTAPQKQGWMAIEWTENPVGFIPDDHEVEAEVMPEYHFTDEGPCGHRIAERALTSLENARWYQAHGYLLKRHVYSSREVIGQAALIDCHAIILSHADMEAFAYEFATVQYKHHEVKPTGSSINAKPVFIVPAGEPEANKRRMLAEGEFITVVKRHGLKPKGTISEFD